MIIFPPDCLELPAEVRPDDALSRVAPMPSTRYQAPRLTHIQALGKVSVDAVPAGGELPGAGPGLSHLSVTSPGYSTEGAPRTAMEGVTYRQQAQGQGLGFLGWVTPVSFHQRSCSPSATEFCRSPRPPSPHREES